jgi:hypothetical protein
MERLRAPSPDVADFPRPEVVSKEITPGLSVGKLIRSFLRGREKLAPVPVICFLKY